MFMVEVFSDKLVTAENKNGKGLIDLDTPEGVAIFGSQKAVDKYKNDKLISDTIATDAEDAAIAKLKGEGKLPADYTKE